METINKEGLIELLNWVISPIIEIQNLDELEKKLKEEYIVLPERLWVYGQKFEYSLDGFLIEMFQRIEYSNKFLYLILNKGRKCLHTLWIIVMLFLLAFVFLLGTILKINGEIFPGIILPLLFLFFIFEKLNAHIFEKILIHMKPGDIIMILRSKDETITKRVKIPMIKEETIFSNPSVFIACSKKKLICENYREKIRTEPKTLYNLCVHFIATDYLISIEQNIDLINYFRILEFPRYNGQLVKPLYSLLMLTV
jgi:hypothetical protein